ncbi:HAMP domain-containing protein, partial [Salmonella enterica]|uniref:HAMP domain-containing protein n=1 Tax=Salmonella enterica TaxID=28901 RepID=UPI003CF43D8B
AAAVRLATRPLRRLADAAERLGADPDAAPLDEAGPRELASAARAFNTMQARIQAHLRERSQILAAITHDLQTPLTRMLLRSELLAD